MKFRLNPKLLNLALLLASLGWLLPSPVPARAASLPDSAFIEGFVGHAQYYSLSCESRSAADWAAFWGVDVTESGFLKKLPRSDNPDEGFVGNPNDLWGFTPPASYGVHAVPVAALLREYGLQAEARQGLKWKDLRAEVAVGRPVIVWVIGQMWTGTARRYKSASGAVAQVAPNEHTMVVIGYNPRLVQVVDAYSGRTLTFSVRAFLASWAVLGNMAIAGEGPAGHQANQGGQNPSTYTVQRGDYLIGLAARFGVTLEALVDLNNIPYPYTIFTGQVLKLPPGSSVQSEPVAPPAQVASGPRLARTYVVKPGDYLKKIAQKFGLDWRILASLNGIQYPYVIYTGQVLRLK